MTFKTLNIGCGATTKGDVNIDLYPEDRTQCMHRWNPKQTPNFVLADAQNLPFKDKCFLNIYCSHVLEHIPNPFAALNEMKRVSTQRTLIFVPSKFFFDANVSHIYSWNQYTLKHLLELVFDRVIVGYTSKPYFGRGRKLFKLFPFINVLFSKIGFFRELYASCYQTE